MSISAEYGITVEDWAVDATDADHTRAAATAELHTRAALAQGMTEDKALEWGANMAMSQMRATVISRRLAAAGAR